MMTYKETLFFIGKCLTINHEKHNFEIVEKHLKNNEVDWESLVKVSTAHYVFPALYCNLKKADFLKYLPLELVEYMQHITDLNRERNKQIIAQAKEINQLLLENNITPIFLKGTGNLLEGLYDDIAERMVGDIDFLVRENDFEKTQNILLSNNYTPITDGPYIKNRHHKRLIKTNNIAAVEVHNHVVSGKFREEFSSKKMLKNIIKNQFLSYENQLCLSIAANQINDKSFKKYSFSLRNCYDTFLISTKTDSLTAIESFPKMYQILNNFLLLTKKVFNTKKISYKDNHKTKKNYNKVIYLLDNKKKRAIINKWFDFKFFTTSRLSIIFKSIYDKENREWLFYRVNNKEWLQQKLIQLGLKKPKPNS